MLNNMLQNNEITLWKQKPSQKQNFFVFVGLAILAVAPYIFIPTAWRHFVILHFTTHIICVQHIFYLITLFCILRAIIVVLSNYSTEYELTSERIIVHSGILTRYSHQLELYRVKDYILISPVKYRIFGISKITLVTADPTQRVLVLDGIYEGETVLKAIRDYVELRRDAKSGIYQIF